MAEKMLDRGGAKIGPPKWGGGNEGVKGSIPHFININIESSLFFFFKGGEDFLILLEGEVLYSLNGFY